MGCTNIPRVVFSDFGDRDKNYRLAEPLTPVVAAEFRLEWDPRGRQRLTIVPRSDGRTDLLVEGSPTTSAKERVRRCSLASHHTLCG